jgi:hypothetical protein
MENLDAKEVKMGTTKHLPLQKFEPVDMPLRGAITPRQAEGSVNSGIVSTNPVDKAAQLVQPLDMVDKSINSPANPLQAGFFVIGQSRQTISSWSEAPSDFFRWHFAQPLHDMTLPLHLGLLALKRKPAAMGK